MIRETDIKLFETIEDFVNYFKKAAAEFFVPRVTALVDLKVWEFREWELN